MFDGWTLGHVKFCIKFHFQIEDFELKFEVDMNSRMVKSDGSVSYKMNCPVPICHRKFTVSFKANYQTKTKRCNSSPTSKWHFYNIQQHLLQNHCDTESEDITSSVDTVKLSDDQPELIVPGKDSPFAFISCDGMPHFSKEFSFLNFFNEFFTCSNVAII